MSDFSEFSSWRDDASSSHATFSGVLNRSVIVNTQRLRMGEHLKCKLEDMMRQRFENYLTIIHALQNDTGKLAALECELQLARVRGAPAEKREPAGINISCKEDGTFLVYRSADAEAMAEESTSPEGEEPSVASGALSPAESNGVGGANSSTSADDRVRKWVAVVSDFGTSGRCHSLTALFHFGYNAWKPMLADGRISFGGADGVPPFQIAEEEEERTREFELREVPELSPAGAAVPELSSAVAEAASSSSQPAPREPRSIGSIVKAADYAADLEQHAQSLDLCTEGIELVREQRRSDERDPDSEAALHQLLLLRAKVRTRVKAFDIALLDAEEIIALQPTWAEGYYWQSVALHGLGHVPEALEAMMSAMEFDPQNPLIQHMFNALFEEASQSPPVAEPQPTAAAQLRGRSSRGASHGLAGDALSTTTQATHLSSRSTTPTEVSAAHSRSSSNDSLVHEDNGAVVEEPSSHAEASSSHAEASSSRADPSSPQAR